MISDGNTAGLESIIKPMLNDDIYISSVITSKASYLIDYYRLHVKSPVREYKLKTFLPTLVSYEIPETVDASGENIISRTVNLFRRQDGAFYIEDTFVSKGDEVSSVLTELRCSTADYFIQRLRSRSSSASPSSRWWIIRAKREWPRY